MHADVPAADAINGVFGSAPIATAVGDPAKLENSAAFVQRGLVLGWGIKLPPLPEIKLTPTDLSGIDPSAALKDLSGELKKILDGANPQEFANQKAAAFHDANPNANFDDCVTTVAAACAAGGAVLGGPAGAALGVGGGVPLARIACRAWFP